MSALTEESARLRERLRAGRPSVASQGYPPALRLEVGRHALRRREEGATWTRIGAELGLSRQSIRVWVRRVEEAEPGGGFVPVALKGSPAALQTPSAAPEAPSTHPEPPSAAPLSLLTPQGHRVEGLDLHGALWLLERLG